MLSLVPLIAALVPLLITPGVLAYFDVTPKIAILLLGVALMLLQVGANSCNVRALWGDTSGRWLVGLLTAEWMAFAIASLAAREPIQIDDVANVATSFPGFPALARAAGLRLQELP